MNLEELFQGKKRVVVCGIGNDIRGDDAFGVLVAERLKELLKNPDVLVLNCGEVPENYTGKIANFKPDLVVLVDAVDFNGEVGEYIIADPEGTLGEAISTHGLPLKFVTQFMKTMVNAEFVLIGCQPGSTGLFQEPSELIRKRAERLAELLAGILKRDKPSTM
ncbi:hydrogenase 3 maturation endopeptidase HyCI [Thermococcus sp. AM4]|uniref:hydrogenase 3 maturation endopeptidase HyCI n=1 Tax=Thermococcus sp. (strain AM4) TaxID=246969 RepID=UPI0001870C29|nr:hydrogenase 3 maturation endopeptidase HyCI [Thermococcus sp. AM4]EEB73460.1 Hydrogenase maturation protease [Thermococcus sp. AM4]